MRRRPRVVSTPREGATDRRTVDVPAEGDDHAPGARIQQSERPRALRGAAQAGRLVPNAAAAQGRGAVGEKGGHAENYEERTVSELKKRAKELGITGYSGKKKAELIDMLRNH